MENQSHSLLGRLCGSSINYMRRFLFNVLSVGPIPNHIAFILDGNRRYARKWKLAEGMGHRAGFLSLMSLMKYCYELGIKYITIYAFSIDNFKRKPNEVKYVMDLMLEKIEGMLKEESIVDQYGVRVYFIGNLKLLNDTLRNAAEKAMKATAKNNRSILLICVAYTSTDEIVHAAQESCEQLWDEMQALKPHGTPLGKISEITEEKEEEPEGKKPGEASGKKYGEESEGKHEQLSKAKLGNIINKVKLEHASEGIVGMINEKLEDMSKGKVGDIIKKVKLENASEGIVEMINEKREDMSKGKLGDIIKKVKLENASEGIVGMINEKRNDMSKEKLGDIINKAKLENASEGIVEMINEKLEDMSIEKLEEKGKEKQNGLGIEMKKVKPLIKQSDIERKMYMGLAPDVDILIRTSGENRLSNFLLWQTWNGLLYAPNALWPEIGLKHLVWAILNFQIAHPLFEKRKKQF